MYNSVVGKNSGANSATNAKNVISEKSPGLFEGQSYKSLLLAAHREVNNSVNNTQNNHVNSMVNFNVNPCAQLSLGNSNARYTDNNATANSKASNDTANKLLGDANGDGELNFDDFKLFQEKWQALNQQKMAGLNLSKIRTYDDVLNAKRTAAKKIQNLENEIKDLNVDMNYDGKVDQKDIGLLLDAIKKAEAKRNILMGDANGDGVIDKRDENLMFDRLFDDSVEVKMDAVDFDGNGEITATDFSEFKRILAEKGSIIKGDLNDDGFIDETDLKLMQKLIFGENLGINVHTADFDDDGNVTASDLSDLAKLVAENRKKLEKEQFYISSGIKGDLNNDGVVDERDAQRFENFNNGTISANKLYNADIDDDGFITSNDEKKLKNLYKYGKWEKPSGIQGDINNDGKVTEADKELLTKFVNGREEKINIYNEDVNNDGKIDEADIRGIYNIMTNRPVDWDESKRLTGDVDGDGRVSVWDAVVLQSYLNGEISKNQIYWDNADVITNGNINSDDVNGIINISNGRIADWNDSKRKTGDLNGDGVVSLVDAQIMMNYLNGDITREQFYWDNAYVNGDSEINHEDYKGIWNIINDQPIDWDDSRYLSGDANGDGVIDIYDITKVVAFLNNQITYQDIYKTNADVNNDGRIDVADITAIQNIINPPAPPQPEPTPIPVYQPWGAVATKTLPAYTKDNLTERIGNECVDKGDKITILDENDFAYFVDYPTPKGNKQRWVSKDVIEAVQPTPTPPNSVYQPWNTIATKTLPAYQDENLTERIGNERVDTGDNITILGENNVAYFVDYPTPTGRKQRWVSKDIVAPIQTEPIPPTPVRIYSIEKQGWKAHAINQTQVFADADLSVTNSNYECVFKNEDVTILEESDISYKIKYWSSSIGAYKERWIAKNALSEPISPYLKSIDKDEGRIVPNPSWIPNNPLIPDIEQRNGEVIRKIGYVGEAGGVVVSDLITTKHDGMVSVTMHVHNTKATNAMLTVYNSDGSVYKTLPIEKLVKWPTDIFSLAGTIGNVTTDTIRNIEYGNDGVKWNNRASAIHKDIYIEVPVGSRIEITTDVSQSRELTKENVAEAVVELFASLVGIAADATELKRHAKIQILQNIDSKSMELLEKLTEELAKKIAEKSGEITLNDYVEYCQNVRKGLKIDIVDMLLKNTTSFGVSVGKEAAKVAIGLANPAVGAAMKVADFVKEVANVSNITCQLYDMWEAKKNHSKYNIDIT